jgi:steroid Delta-isomerase
MNSQGSRNRVARHVAAFNDAVQTGDWSSFAGRFTHDATMSFTGVPAGPFAGRAAIAEAYARQPPADTMSVQQADSAGAVDMVRFAWGKGGGGVMRLTWQGQLIASLDVTFTG